MRDCRVRREIGRRAVRLPCARRKRAATRPGASSSSPSRGAPCAQNRWPGLALLTRRPEDRAGLAYTSHYRAVVLHRRRARSAPDRLTVLSKR